MSFEAKKQDLLHLLQFATTICSKPENVLQNLPPPLGGKIVALGADPQKSRKVLQFATEKTASVQIG